MKCAGCGLVFLNPRPAMDQVGEFYQNQDYDPFLSLQSSKGILDHIYSLARKQTLIWKKRLVDRVIRSVKLSDETKSSNSKDSILDIGCGTGEFLSALSGDYSVEGIEPEPKAAQWARQQFGLEVHTGNLASTAALNADKYALITLWHALEHVPEPLNDLEIIQRLLLPNGLLLIALPNIRSFDAKIYRSCWIALDAPRHFWHFSKSQLELLTRKSGFKLIKSGMLPLDTIYNSLYSEMLCKTIKGNRQIALTPFRLTISVLSSLVWGVLSGQHSGIYYIFRKL
ncbi:MAG: class I SAM-dependent methyltransferase [Candidatus Hatepunaea meridiana]|nr:class I SAM-dependent methyltransferase [Candidatus Hatepunaea meridiana]